ncbi:type 4 pilus major pilin [Burkholderia sp. WAC0059]|uniref:type 4 pilus major pilin n=1 Tax=Burkholderia sp. WAC0059 TaxID=2066022 RepID=UPI0015E0EBC4|nr:type 4 pilus major pilin [Burkholderia sp. WAC0059]
MNEPTAGQNDDALLNDPLPERRRQRGASLVEALAFLSTAAIVSVNSLSLLNTAFNEVGSNSLVQDTATIQQGVRMLYQRQAGTYAGLDDSVLLAANVFPSTLHSSPDGEVTNQWGGQVEVIPSPDDPGTFELAYTNLPQSACVSALVDTPPTWSAVGVAGGSDMVAPSDVTPQVAASQCAQEDNTVIWLSS